MKQRRFMITCRIITPLSTTPSVYIKRIQTNTNYGFRETKTLEAYEYTIKHKPGKELVNADVLSRLALSRYPETVPVSGDIHLLIQHLDSTPVTATEIKVCTDKDLLLAKSDNMSCRVGQMTELQKKHCSMSNDDLSVHSGCLPWGSGVVVPPQGHELIVRELHESHPR